MRCVREVRLVARPATRYSAAGAPQPVVAADARQLGTAHFVPNARLNSVVISLRAALSEALYSIEIEMAQQYVKYRKLAFAHYDPVCAHCGFGIPAVLEVAHIDCDRSNNDISNLVILCPNCHKMHDLDIISTETIIQMRDRPKVVNWSKRMKDAGRKAALARDSKAAGQKAAETRRRNREAEQSDKIIMEKLRSAEVDE
jgi:hypothetical protein